MHQYDLASKILMETCRDEIVRYFTDADVDETSIVEELPQETVSLKRSDFPVKIKDKAGNESLALIELQTLWNQDVSLNLLDYRTRYKIKYKMKVISCVILLKSSGTAADEYEDNEVRFRYRLVKIYEMDAREIVDHGPFCLLPFTPLMKNGEETMTQADDLIYKSERSRVEKADLLTSMAILSGIVSTDLPVQLIRRRRDIMIESAAYDIIKEEGIQQGIQQGTNSGMILDAREMLLDVIETRFRAIPPDIAETVNRISDRSFLKLLHKQAIICDSPDVLRKAMSEYEG